MYVAAASQVRSGPAGILLPLRALAIFVAVGVELRDLGAVLVLDRIQFLLSIGALSFGAGSSFLLPWDRS
jgi:hypothetical protein